MPRTARCGNAWEPLPLPFGELRRDLGVSSSLLARRVHVLVLGGGGGSRGQLLVLREFLLLALGGTAQAQIGYQDLTNCMWLQMQVCHKCRSIRVVWVTTTR